jgi:hypothetical protein
MKEKGNVICLGSIQGACSEAPGASQGAWSSQKGRERPKIARSALPGRSRSEHGSEPGGGGTLPTTMVPEGS